MRAFPTELQHFALSLLRWSFIARCTHHQIALASVNAESLLKEKNRRSSSTLRLHKTHPSYEICAVMRFANKRSIGVRFDEAISKVIALNTHTSLICVSTANDLTYRAMNPTTPDSLALYCTSEACFGESTHSSLADRDRTRGNRL
jgi:hypothetical protein